MGISSWEQPNVAFGTSTPRKELDEPALLAKVVERRMEDIKAQFDELFAVLAEAKKVDAVRVFFFAEPADFPGLASSCLDGVCTCLTVI